MRRVFASVLLLAFSTSALAETGVASLSWMKGRWAGDLGPATLEETWNDPRANTMVAVVRMSSPQGLGFVETIIINEEDDTLVLRLQQFSATFEPLMPAPHRMVMSEQSETSITFTAESGPLTKLSYTRDGDTFTIAGENPQGPFAAPLQAVE